MTKFPFEFSKYHGVGNDFIITMTNYISDIPDIPKLVSEITNRNTGIGADGFICVDTNPLRMRIYNQDGSIAPMCGNGLRCFLNYCYDEKIYEMKINEPFQVVTDSGIETVNVISFKPFISQIYFNKIGISNTLMDIDETKPIFPLLIGKEKIYNCYVGTHHSIIFTETFDNIEKIGKKISNNPIFKRQTNVDFVKVVNRNEIIVRTYERGVGLTKACGTGASASAYVCYKLGLCDNVIKVLLELGKLTIRINNDKICLEGPSEFVFKHHE